MTNQIDTMDYMGDWMDKVFNDELDEMFEEDEENEMKFTWEMNEDTWNKFASAVKEKKFDIAHNVGEYLGCCRIGDLCFDIRAWSPGEFWTGWGFELFCGGVDSGYGYSAKEAMETGKYKSKSEVPDELLYPYDEVDYGDFPAGIENNDMKAFQTRAEEIFKKFIADVSPRYSNANLIDKANEELRIW